MSRLVLSRYKDLSMVTLLCNSLLSETKYVGARCSYSSKESSKSDKKTVAKLPTIEDDEMKSPVSRILLLNIDKKAMGSMTLEEAHLVAKRRNLKLAKIEEVSPGKNRQDIYQLLAAVDKSSSKEDKILSIGAKITEHDLGIRVKSIQKWFTKGFVVRISIHEIQSTNEGENIFSRIEKAAVEGNYKVVQKQSVADGKTLKFILQPDKKKATPNISTQDTADSQPLPKS